MSSVSRKWEKQMQARAERAKAKHDALEHLGKGNAFPFDAPDQWWQELPLMPPPAIDAAHCAARGVMSRMEHMLPRRQRFNESLRKNVVETIAEIIRQAMRMASKKPSTRRILKPT